MVSKQKYKEGCLRPTSNICALLLLLWGVRDSTRLWADAAAKASFNNRACVQNIIRKLYLNIAGTHIHWTFIFVEQDSDALHSRTVLPSRLCQRFHYSSVPSNNVHASDAVRHKLYYGKVSLCLAHCILYINVQDDCCTASLWRQKQNQFQFGFNLPSERV